MKKIQLNAAKLQLNKEKVTSLTEGHLSKLAGGGNDANPKNVNTKKITQDIDVPTIGHDDGPNCLSASDWGWCWCHGV